MTNRRKMSKEAKVIGIASFLILSIMFNGDLKYSTRHASVVWFIFIWLLATVLTLCICEPKKFLDTIKNAAAKKVNHPSDNSSNTEAVDDVLDSLSPLEEGYLEAISSEYDRELYVEGYKKLRADERMRLVGEWQLEQIKGRGEELKGEYIKKMREDPQSYLYKNINKYPPYLRAVEANKKDYREEKARIRGAIKILRAGNR